MITTQFIQKKINTQLINLLLEVYNTNWINPFESSCQKFKPKSPDVHYFVRYRIFKQLN